jgi:hypothetical protein
MTIAAELMQIARNANDAMEQAEEKTSNIDQDWEHEATLYTFEDASVLVVSGSQVNAFESREAADKELSA